MPKFGSGGEEFEVKNSNFPSRDGKDYSESMPTPSWSDLIDLLRDEDITGDFDILYVGRLGSDGSEISGYPDLVNAVDVINVYRENPGESTEYLAFLLSKMDPMPAHITGIVVRKRLYTKQPGFGGPFG